MTTLTESQTFLPFVYLGNYYDFGHKFHAKYDYAVDVSFRVC